MTSRKILSGDFIRATWPPAQWRWRPPKRILRIRWLIQLPRGWIFSVSKRIIKMGKLAARFQW
ncbi:MAG TPA: hypothetical protein VFV58_23280 [Blastocatellia bacterium]|nr:hypothetical protein [Blastocatellia bacterium]